MTQKSILAIDQGTTGSTALLVSHDLKILSQATVNFEQHYPQPSWVEHDLNQVWDSVVKAVSQCLDGQDANSIEAIGITNQRETVCFWDRATGTPLSRAIVWQDRRTADDCEKLREKGVEPFVQESTGLLLDPYFSGTKASWALKNWEDLSKSQKLGKLAVGTIDSYLVARMAGGGVHVTEPSNACRTLCYHLEKHQWDDELCAALELPKDIWPEVLPSSGVFAKTKGFPGLPDGIPISGVLGDQQSALLGQACFEPGSAKCTYGTGAFILMNTGSKIARSRHRLLSSVAWSLKPGEFTYCMEGSAFIAGAAVQWFRESLGLIKESKDIEPLAAQVESTEGVTFVPSLTGLGAPYWDPHATGMFTGITRGSRGPHLARAVLEGIAFQIADILSAMEADLKSPLSGLRVDGGASKNNLLMQFQADILKQELVRPQVIETTAMGAVFAAGLGVGIWSSLEDVSKAWKKDRAFEPAFSDERRTEEIRRWQKAVKRVQL